HPGTDGVGEVLDGLHDLRVREALVSDARDHLEVDGLVGGEGGKGREEEGRAEEEGAEFHGGEHNSERTVDRPRYDRRVAAEPRPPDPSDYSSTHGTRLCRR